MASQYRLQEESPPVQARRGRSIAYRRMWWVALLAAVVAGAANAIVFLIEKNVLGLPMLISTPPATDLAPLSLLMVVEVSVIAALAASLLVILLALFTMRPVRWFQIISVIFLLISFAGPFSVPVDMATQIALSVMHIVAAVAIVWIISTQARVEPEER